VVKIHSQNITQGQLKRYDAKWVTEQVCKIKDINYKSDIISALQIMFQVEIHNVSAKSNRFMAWDISQADWQKNYQSGRVGSCAWDIASIVNHVNNSKFSDIFLENYLRYGGEKPTLSALYANLYYVKVFEAIKNRNFENITETTRKIIEDTAFNTDIISYEVLLKLNIIGY
jgi:hypothetical protein